jgi:hypothetical protein
VHDEEYHLEYMGKVYEASKIAIEKQKMKQNYQKVYKDNNNYD